MLARLRLRPPSGGRSRFGCPAIAAGAMRGSNQCLPHRPDGLRQDRRGPQHLAASSAACLSTTATRRSSAAPASTSRYLREGRRGRLPAARARGHRGADRARAASCWPPAAARSCCRRTAGVLAERGCVVYLETSVAQQAERVRRAATGRCCNVDPPRKLRQLMERARRCIARSPTSPYRPTGAGCTAWPRRSCASCARARGRRPLTQTAHASRDAFACSAVQRPWTP